MRGLLLVDLDNVLDEDFPVESFGDRAARALAELEIELTSCVVALAFNTTTMFRYELHWPRLDELGQALGGALGISNPELDVAITLTMPQTADVALCQLLRGAPETETQAVQLVGVFSGDVGLAESVGQSVERIGWVERQKRGWLGDVWQMPEGGKPLRRKAAGTGPRAEGRPPSNLADYTVEVAGDHGAAAWAAARGIDLSADVGWVPDLSNLLEREPWLLTEVSVTPRCVRGVARLRGLMAGTSTSLDPVGRNDGLEVRGEGGRPRQAGAPRRASIGIGAVHFDEGGLTARSRIPAEVLAQVESPLALAPSGVMVSRALAKLPVGEPLEGPRVKVRMENRGAVLVAKVQHADDKQPAAWWIVKERTTTEVRVNGARCVPKPTTAEALPMYPATRTDYRLVLAAPFPEEPVQVEGRITQGTIGRGYWRRANKKKCSVALLALGGSLDDGATTRAVPIQSLSRSGALARFPVSFWNLPLVVAR